MLKRIEPWGYVVDVTRIEPTNPHQGQILPEDLELEATDYREIDPPPAASDHPYYEEQFSRYRGFFGAVSGLLILVGISLTVGAVSGAVQHQLQQGGSADVRR